MKINRAKNEVCYRVAYNLQRLKKRKGVTTKEIADKMGMGKCTISNHLNGYIFPTSFCIQCYADYFGVDISEIFKGVENETERFGKKSAGSSER